MRTGNGNGNNRVEGVHLVAYQGKQLDLNRIGKLVGTYASRIGSSTHDVYDVPRSALHPFVQDRIPDTIASDPKGETLRLYVEKSRRGHISDIGLVNGVYKAPAHPFVPRNGPIYTAPADAEKYRSVAPSRPKGSLVNPWTDSDGWEPRPGDRFKLTEIS